MSELDEIRKKRMAELQAQLGKEQEASPEQQLAQQFAALEAQVRPLLTKEALTRYFTIKTAHGDKALQVLAVIAQLAQAGKVKQVDDDLLKKIAMQLTPAKRETTIKRV